VLHRRGRDSASLAENDVEDFGAQLIEESRLQVHGGENKKAYLDRPLSLVLDVILTP
jgi:uncharacterized protein YceK